MLMTALAMVSARPVSVSEESSSCSCTCIHTAKRESSEMPTNARTEDPRARLAAIDSACGPNDAPYSLQSVPDQCVVTNAHGPLPLPLQCSECHRAWPGVASERSARNHRHSTPHPPRVARLQRLHRGPHADLRLPLPCSCLTL